MDIYNFTPYAQNGNLGNAYNDYMALLPNDDDYACFIDGDAMFLTDDWGHQIYEIVKKNPQVGMFTCYASRVGCPAQLYNGEMSEIGDIRHHRRVAYDLKDRYKTKLTNLPNVISGHLMIIQKKTWKRFKFPNGLLGVDNYISGRIQQAGLPVVLMRGVYVMHYYRLLEGRKYKNHLNKFKQVK